MDRADELYSEGEKLKDQREYQQAAEKFQASLEVREDNVLTHLALAVVYTRLGQHEQAVSHGQRACELDSQDPVTFTAMSMTYQRAFEGTQDHQFIQLAEQARDKAQWLAQQAR